MNKTPYYVFDADALSARIERVRRALDGMPLTFSLKANAFLLETAVSRLDFIEVCSPGETAVCRRMGISPDRIIFSGVVKGKEDIQEALDYGAGILTAESRGQAELISEAAEKTGRKARALMRLSSGNQFGMDAADIREILDHRDRFPGVRWLGYHYYSGTQKKKPEGVRRDLEHLGGVIDRMEKETGFTPEWTEYGPGLAADYFGPDPEKTDMELLDAAAKEIRGFGRPLKIEMGRFLAAPCGSYHTRVKDLKTVNGVRYALLDGGIHHLQYYGQMMAMNVPPLRQEPVREGEAADYCLCGSLCTTADVLVRKAKLFPLRIGDELVFGRCGAYSVTEAPVLFLSRDFPEIRLKRGGEETVLRSAFSSWPLNMPEAFAPARGKEGV